MLRFRTSRRTKVALLIISVAVASGCLLPNWDLVLLANRDGLDAISGHAGADAIYVGLFATLLVVINLLTLVWELGAAHRRRFGVTPSPPADAPDTAPRGIDRRAQSPIDRTVANPLRPTSGDGGLTRTLLDQPQQEAVAYARAMSPNADSAINEIERLMRLRHDEAISREEYERLARTQLSVLTIDARRALRRVVFASYATAFRANDVSTAAIDATARDRTQPVAPDKMKWTEQRKRKIEAATRQSEETELQLEMTDRADRVGMADSGPTAVAEWERQVAGLERLSKLLESGRIDQTEFDRLKTALFQR